MATTPSTETEGEASNLRLEVEDKIGTLWLDRPEKQNAMTLAMWAGLPSLLDEAAERVRILVLRGVGEHFCSGADIASIGTGLADAGDPEGYRAINERAEEALARFPRPVVAAISGNCVGGGCQLIAACDLRVATTAARFGITPAKLGISYPARSVLRTADLIGVGATKHLLFTADLIDADEALRIGLVDVICAPEELDQRVDEMVATLASRSLVTQLATKELLAERLTMTTEMAGSVAKWEHIARSGPDLEEGLAAFSERRSPGFTWIPEP
jgi:enoyl-CoA hydratase/carnithine racemase